MSSTHGRFQLSGALSGSATKTEYKDDKSEKSEVPKTDESKKEAEPTAKPNGGGLFGGLSSGATAGGSLFGALGSTSGSSLFGGGFKFTPSSTAAGGSSIFGGGSLFGGVPSTSGSLFGAASTGGSLFSNTTPLFGGQNSLFKKPDEAAEGSGNEEEDENFGKGDGSPPAFGATTSDTFGGASKPIKLNIESRPPEKSPYEKIFNVSTLSLTV